MKNKPNTSTSMINTVTDNDIQPGSSINQSANVIDTDLQPISSNNQFANISASDFSDIHVSNDSDNASVLANQRNSDNSCSDQNTLNRLPFTLKCGSLNVCGIKRKMQYPELCELICNYDLFCVTETKIDNHDIITLPGYNFLSQSRKQKYLRKSGGIGVFVKDYIAPHISLLESDSDYILWFKLSKSFLQADEDLFFGIVYLPPSESRFHNSDELDLFEVEITNMCVLHKYVFLMGDFNARTQSKNDFIDINEFTEQELDNDDFSDQFFDVHNLLSHYNLDHTRASHDKYSNNEGNFLLDICKTNNLFILNGRCGKDKGIGNFTFRNLSVIDYSIASAFALKYIKEFEITELDCLYSDGHSLLSTVIEFKKAPCKVTKKPNSENQHRKPRWKNDKKSEFLLNIDQNKLSEIAANVQIM
ncbi:MAG: endonuclease/exonuclease/phosphatase family protein, partial [Candidatus Thiodiazotropha sp.]